MEFCFVIFMAPQSKAFLLDKDKTLRGLFAKNVDVQEFRVFF